MTAFLRQARNFGQAEISAHDLWRSFKVGDGFKQRHCHDRGLRRRAICSGAPEARFFEEDVDFQQIRNALRLGDDIVGNALRAVGAMGVGGGVHDGELGCGLLRIFRGIRAERPIARQFAAQQCHARMFVERSIVRLDPCNLQQFGDDPLMNVAILPEVERGKVEAEGLDRTDQAVERTAGGQRPVSCARQTLRHDDKVTAQIGGGGISLRV